MRYILSEWENNQYHDSYFQAAVWDTETQTVKKIETGSTAYASRSPDGHEYSRDLTAEVVEKSLEWLAGAIFGQIRAAEHRDIFSPDNIEIGQKVRLLKAHKNQRKEAVQAECRKCDGTGQWVNPWNDEDNRQCFTCKGKGELTQKGDKVRDENGKLVWDHFDADTAGKVVWVGTFRTIWAKGYNSLNNGTLSTKVELEDGRVINVPLKKLRLDQDPLTDEVLHERAVDLSLDAQFGAALDPRFAWHSRNQVAEWLRNKSQQRVAA